MSGGAVIAWTGFAIFVALTTMLLLRTHSQFQAAMRTPPYVTTRPYGDKFAAEVIRRGTAVDQTWSTGTTPEEAAKAAWTKFAGLRTFSAEELERAGQ